MLCPTSGGWGWTTLAEVAPRLAEKIRTFNAMEGTHTFIAPIVVYLEDETHADLEVPEPDSHQNSSCRSPASAPQPT